jgi:hypothetical protein
MTKTFKRVKNFAKKLFGHLYLHCAKIYVSRPKINALTVAKQTMEFDGVASASSLRGSNSGNL